jgi:hypothetical protein
VRHILSVSGLPFFSEEFLVPLAAADNSLLLSLPLFLTIKGKSSFAKNLKI